jgi:hypothetical protein
MEGFEELLDPRNNKLDSVIVLDASGYTVRDSSIRGRPLVQRLGYVFSSPALLTNIPALLEAKGDNMNLCADGTYKLDREGEERCVSNFSCYTGWVCCSVGTTTIHYDNGGYRQKFIPIAYMLCESEAAEAYEKLFNAIVLAALHFFGIEGFTPRCMQQDHSDACAKAARTVWPEIEIILCWPHIARKALKENLAKFKHKEYAKTAERHLRLLHACCTEMQFYSVWSAISAAWQAAGEKDLCIWFEDEYIVAPWYRWFVTASGVPGIVASQNAIESEHRVLKTTKVRGELRVTLGRFISVNIPRILTAARSPEFRQCGDDMIPIVSSWGDVPVPSGYGGPRVPTAFLEAAATLLNKPYLRVAGYKDVGSLANYFRSYESGSTEITYLFINDEDYTVQVQLCLKDSDSDYASDSDRKMEKRLI